MFIRFPSSQHIRAAPWERDEERLLGGTWQQSEIKAGSWTPRKGTHTSQTKQNKQRNKHLLKNRQQVSETQESEVTASGNDQPFLPAPDLLTMQLVNGVLQNSGDSRESQTPQQESRAEVDAGGRAKRSTASLCRCHRPPTQPFFIQLSLMRLLWWKGPVDLKKIFFY